MREHRTDTFVRYAQTPTSDRCAVFDMDDTLCHYDTSLRLPKCDRFEAREEELALALSLSREGVDVVVATARPCWTVPKTLEWLERHGVPVSALYVKNRRNYKVVAHDLKVGMLRDLQDTYEVVGFWDDSPFTVAAARALGVPATYVPGNETYWQAKGESFGWVLPDGFLQEA